MRSSVALPPRLPGPAFAQTLASLFAAERFDAYVTARYPAVLRMKIVGVGEVVVIRDPADVKSLFTAKPGSVEAGEINKRVVPVLSGDSIMMLDGDRHLRMRRLLLPPFHGDAIRAHASMIEAIVLEGIARWPRDRPFAVHPKLQAITLEVILSVVLGIKDRIRRDELRAVLPRVLEINPLVVLLEGRWPSLVSGPFARLRPLVRARRRAQALLREEIAAHRAGGDEQDVLAMLLASRDEDGRGLSESELEDQLMTLLLAGHETTASSLAWCFERFLRHPGAVERIRLEAESGHSTFLEAAINETFRTRPVVEVVWRILREPMTLGGFELGPGTTVAAVIRAIGREGYEDPLAFKPERFLDAAPAPYSLVPFGGGTRRCLGASFASAEMKIVLSTLIDRLDLAPADPKPERVSRTRRFTSSPSRGGRIVARDRR